MISQDIWVASTSVNSMNEKLSILTELIKLAKIDKKHGDEEYDFLKLIAASLLVPMDQLDDLFSKYSDCDPPSFETDRITQFQRLILLANVDMEADSRESELIKEAGLRLGLRTEAIENVLAEMRMHGRGMIPEDKLMAIFKVHHN